MKAKDIFQELAIIQAASTGIVNRVDRDEQLIRAAVRRGLRHQEIENLKRSDEMVAFTTTVLKESCARLFEADGHIDIRPYDGTNYSTFVKIASTIDDSIETGAFDESSILAAKEDLKNILVSEGCLTYPNQSLHDVKRRVADARMKQGERSSRRSFDQTNAMS